MVRVRNLVLAIAAATALTSEFAHALGLGEVTLQSSLNQPLRAEIELLDAKTLAQGEVVPTLASAEDFNKAGVDRLYFLTDLKFTPVLRPDGKSVIQVTSSKPVREPYLNFLVEVMWPNGRLLREYTLLLDPPLYSPETAAAAAPQLPIVPPAPRQQVPVRSAPPAAAVGPSGGTAGAPASGEYRTTSRDTLWEIAERHSQGGSVHQTMLAIQELNPNAFMGGNINRMKQGQVLRLPTAEQIRARTQTEAIAQVAEQNAAWRQGLGSAPARQLDATQRDVAGASPSRSESGDNLRLVAPEAGSADSGSDRGAADGDAKTLSNKLAVTQESLDSSRRENEELQDRLQDLQGQLDKLQRLMALKDDQLAKLQAQLGQEPDESLASAGAAADVPPGPESQPVEPDSGAPSLADPTLKGEGEPNLGVGADSPIGAAADTPMNGSDQSPAPTEPTPDPAASLDPAGAEPEVAAPVPASAPVDDNESFVNSLLGNHLMLGLAGGGALLLLLVGLMALSRRNAMKEAELHDSETEDSHFAVYGDDHSEQSAYTHELAEQDSAVSEAEAPVRAQSSDPLAEADIYIAYGRFNQAAELLQGALDREPQRADLRLKLMEVYAELGDREAFARQEAELREIGGAGSDIERLKAKYPAMALAGSAGLAGAAAATQLDDLNLDDLDLGNDNEPVSSPAAEADGFDMDLDLDSLGLTLDEQTPGEVAMNGFDDPAPAQSQSLDNEPMSFDQALAMNTAGTESASELDELSFELDDLESLEPRSVEQPLADDFDFELADETPSRGEQAAALNDGFDFDLLEERAIEPTGSDSLPDDFDLAFGAPAETVTAQPDHLAEELEAVEEELGQIADELESREALNSSEPALDLPADDDFDFIADTDETATKLDLAKAYIDMGDAEGARDILDEVMSEGSDTQQQEARDMLARLG